jgi:hypothetical protein
LGDVAKHNKLELSLTGLKTGKAEAAICCIQYS